MNAPESSVRADTDRLAARLNSEEGIPMFLACENLVENETAEESEPLTLTTLNEDLAAAFRRDSDGWELIRSGAPLTDLAKIVEVLADRDFAAPAAENQP